MADLIAKCLSCVQTLLVQAMEIVPRASAIAHRALEAISVRINWVLVNAIVERKDSVM
jgi:hypothetical protein